MKDLKRNFVGTFVLTTDFCNSKLHYWEVHWELQIYKIKKKKKNNLQYMDDIKLFAKIGNELEILSVKKKKN